MAARLNCLGAVLGRKVRIPFSPLSTTGTHIKTEGLSRVPNSTDPEFSDSQNNRTQTGGFLITQLQCRQRPTARITGIRFTLPYL